MSLHTKMALAQSLKKVMKIKPFSKVTVSELIKDCNINRNTFYYHFTDIYDLLKWMFEQEAVNVVKRIDLLLDTEEAMRFVVNYVDENQHIINCAYDSIGHEQMKRFFYADFIGIMQNVIDSGESELGVSVDPRFKKFLAEFYTEALAGALLAWVKDSRRSDKEELIQEVLFVCKTSIPHLLRERAEQEAL